MSAKEPRPVLRGSSNEQDTRATTLETAVQTRPPRSILKSLRVERVAPSAIADVIEREHYLHSMPKAAQACFGVYAGGGLAGAVVFTSGARQGHRVLEAARPQDVATLARLWLADDLPQNAESRVLGIVLRAVHRETSWKLVLSYADPGAGHVGTIYQATGWVYLGQAPPEGYIAIGDSRERHPRSVYTQYGSNAIGHLRATGVPARRVFVSGKHRYVYVLDAAWRWRLRAAAQPYPRLMERGPP